MKTASAIVRLADPAAVLAALTAHLAEHDVEVRLEGGLARAKLTSGEAAIRIEPSGMTLEASAGSEAALEDVTGFLASHVAEFAHPERPSINWSGFQPRRTFADFREMRVISVCDLTPTLRRIRLSGDDLARFDTDDNLHVRLFFPPEGCEPVWPIRGADGLVQHASDPAHRPVVRKYTIRKIDAASGWVDIDFVRHADPGPGSDWAKRAVAGDVIGMAGPGGRTAKQARWLLLAGDETALPAIARILEALPAETTGTVLLQAESPAETIALEGPAGVAIRWIFRSNGSQGLADAVLQVEVPSDPSRFCWAGAEFEDVQAIRRHWREACGMDSSEQLAVAYWRRGVADAPG